ncbi:hypothetical protein GCM10010310_57500 [Streptomyces violaceolatus]|uniref:Uncharacterized protein n=1 Tax=Streptomyces violaceolatus TaxID=67378 RepID=A0ABN3T927_9ACTN
MFFARTAGLAVSSRFEVEQRRVKIRPLRKSLAPAGSAGIALGAQSHFGVGLHDRLYSRAHALFIRPAPDHFPSTGGPDVDRPARRVFTRETSGRSHERTSLDLA